MMSPFPDRELPCNVAVGIGDDGDVLISHLLADPSGIGVASTLLAYGKVHGDRPSVTGFAGRVQYSSASDITLLPSEFQRINEANIDAPHTDMRAHVLAEFWEKLLKVVPPSTPIHPQLLGCAGLGDIDMIAPGLSHLKTTRLPNLSITLCVRWPEPGHEDDRTAAGIRRLIALRHDDIVDGVHLIHPRSHRARVGGEDVQNQLVARVAAAQLAAQCSDRQNKRLADVSRSVGKLAGTRGTFACMAVDVARVAEGKRSGFSRPLRWSGKPDIGYGDMTDCIRQATSLAVRLLEDESARTFAAPFDPTLPPFELLFVVPFPRTDPRFPHLVSHLRAWQTAHVPAAGTALVVSGSGRLGQHVRGRYYCLVAYLFPIADELVLPAAENLNLTPTPKRKGERQ